MDLQRSIRVYIQLMIISILTIIFMVCHPCIAQEQEEEETYSISLVQTAEVDREIYEVEGKKVLTESYTVEKGDHIWNLLRKRGLLEKRNLMEILEVLKTLNSSLTNLDLIYPGEEIIIPLIITPVEGGRFYGEADTAMTVPLESIEDLEHYTVMPGDSLIKVVKRLYDIPEEDIYNEYLDQLKKMNPSIRDLNNIFPGQKVRLPIYSPQVVRLPIKTPPDLTESETRAQKDNMKLIGLQLGEIFTLIGEEWLQSGEHFIPLKSGGQINLNADSYPIIDLRSGKRIIVDLYNDLPENMAELIRSSWDNYAIVHLRGDEDLKEAIDRIIILCDYQKIQGMNEPLILGGDIPLRITADWIIQLAPEQSSGEENIVIVNFLDDAGSATPGTIGTFLEDIGIRAVDYPPSLETIEESVEDAEILPDTGDDRGSLIEMLLSLNNRTFSRNKEIPIFQNQQADFNLIVKADFLLDIDGGNYVIDLTGLGQDIIALLKEHQFHVLSLANEKSSSDIVTRTLEFLGIDYDSEPHPFWAAERTELKNIMLMIPGIVFRDSKYQNIFATHISIPPEITNFLARKGYRILRLPPP